MFAFLRYFFLLFFVSVATTFAAAELKKSAFDLPSNPQEYEFLTVALTAAVPELTLATDSAFELLDRNGQLLFGGAKFAPTPIRAQATGIRIGSQTFHDAPITLLSENGAIKVKDKVYRHAVKIWPEPNGKISAVNEIPVEDYLKGVLPKEVTPTWPTEALKAQAIAARTYAIFKGIENKARRYSLSKDVLSQVYGGKSSEHFATTQAVQATQGLILVYDGKIFPTYFHSTCGGATTHAEYLWPVEPHPVLKGIRCNFCRDSKHYKWTADFRFADIEAKLKNKGIRVSSIQDIQPVEKDETGRARYFLITSRTGQVRVHSNDFRLWVDPGKLKSTWILSTSKQQDSIRMTGRGWGHGVGLCQYGMKQLAELGYGFEDILKYYYPGAQILSLEALPSRMITSSPQKRWLHKAKQWLDLE